MVVLIGYLCLECGDLFVCAGGAVEQRRLAGREAGQLLCEGGFFRLHLGSERGRIRVG